MTRVFRALGEASTMKRLLFLASFLSLLVVAAWAEKLYVDPATKLQFPERSGVLSRTEVEDLSAGPGGGVAVQYGGTEGLEARASIFLYTPSLPLAQEMEGTDQALKMTYGEPKLLEKRAVANGRYKGELRRYELTMQGRAVYSEVRLYDLGKTFFKLRLTGNIKDRTVLQREGEALVARVLR